jgi:hypothetical protein
MSPRLDQAEQRPRRTTLVILLSVGIFLSFFLVLSQASFNLTFMHPNASPLAFAALSALIFLLLVALTFVLLRNLLKLFAERRGGVLGSKFRTKMVVGALALSFAPVIFLFLFAYGLMNRSIDKWFSARWKRSGRTPRRFPACSPPMPPRTRAPKPVPSPLLPGPGRHLRPETLMVS